MIQSPRLTMHLLTEDDANLMLQLLNEPSFIANFADRGVRTAEQALRYLQDGPLASYQQHGFGMYRVERREDGVTLEHRTV